MINSIIVQYLKHNKRLVIPGFGAFIKKDETGEVVFVEFLKKDDGVLVSALQSGYSLDRSEAVEIIENYVINTKKHILNTGSFIIGNLGVMHVDANSVYNFEYQPDVVEQKAAKPHTVREVITPEIAKPEVVRSEIARTETIAQPTIKPEPTRQTSDTPKVTPKVIPNVAPDVEQPKWRPMSQTVTQTVAQTMSHPTQAVSQPSEQSGGRQSESSDNTVFDREPIDVKGLRYQKPTKPVVPGQNKKKTDMIMLIAIVAAAIAIIAMIYGMFGSENPELTLEPSAPAPQQTEATASQPTK